MSRFENLNKGQSTLLMTAVVLLIFFFLFALAEGAVRIRHYLKYGEFHGIENTYMIDPKSKLRIPIPNKTTSRIQINSFGFRSPEITQEKPENTIRIAFLGASTTYCAEVSSNKMMWSDILTRRLNQTLTNKKIDYINGGVPGYSLDDSLKNLKYRISPFHPDVIVIYHATNDLSFNTRVLAKQQGIITEKEHKNDGLSWFSQYSLLSYLVEKNLKILSLQSQSKKIQGALKYNITDIVTPFEKDLKTLVDESKKVAKKVILVTFSHHIRAEQSLEEKTKASNTSLYYMPYMTVDELLEGFNAYNETIRKVAKDKQVELIDNPNFIPGNSIYFNDSVHFTDKGSEKMAERLFLSITTEKLIN